MRVAALSVTALALASCVQGAPIPQDWYGMRHARDQAPGEHSSTNEKLALGFIGTVVTAGLGLAGWILLRGRNSAPSASTAMTSSGGGGGGGSSILHMAPGAIVGGT